MILGKRGMRRVHLVEAEDDMGGIMRWIPQLPGLGEWARVVNYRKIQIDKLQNVEFIPGHDARRERREGVRRRDRRRSRPARYWATDGLNGCTHDTIPGADASRPACLTPEQIMVDGKEVARRARRHRRQRRLLHGRVARREAGARGQEGHAHDAPRAHRALHALHARGAEPCTASCTSSASRSSRTTCRPRSSRAACHGDARLRRGRRTSRRGRRTRSCSSRSVARTRRSTAS